MDTMLVNGTVYPYLDVEPKAYRFRILNAGNDRFLNLSLYKANPGIVGSLVTIPGSGYTADPIVTVANAAGDTTGHGFTLSATADVTAGSPTFGQVSFAIESVGSNYTLPPVITVTAPGDPTGTSAAATAVLYGAAPGQDTEVGMVPATVADSVLPPFDVSGIPDPAMAGPDWWQIGTEGGFLPAPVVVPAHPTSWNLNPTVFNFGVVDEHSLLLGTAERADVIVDFSAYSGQTLILYNDAPAAFPAAVPNYDYYTNDQDQTATGGAPTTPPGKGPNTRTVMQIRVGSTVTTPTTDVTLANLNAVWAKTAEKRGVFERSQDPIIIPQAAYNSAYGVTNFPTSATAQFVQIFEHSKTFQPINANGVLQPPVTVAVQPKGAHDEMGGVYDTHYGRMSGMLGLEVPASTSQIAQFIPYGYASPPVELVKGTDITATPMGTLDDGTQIWNITHNGVDTHTIHTHLFNAQLINRVSWDGLVMMPPDPSELGWKETFRMNPLEMIIIAMRPALPTTAQIPFLDQVPNSVRLIDPTIPEGALLDPPPPVGFSEPIQGDPIVTNGVEGAIANHKVNFGWEYVYHCHILAHEEMDMMHDVSFVVPPKAPTMGSYTIAKNKVTLTWTDNAVNETGFTVQKKEGTGAWTTLAKLPAKAGSGTTVTFTDPTNLKTKKTYYYRVFASNTVGDTMLYDIGAPGGALVQSFPTMTATSAFSGTVTIIR